MEVGIVKPVGRAVGRTGMDGRAKGSDGSGILIPPKLKADAVHIAAADNIVCRFISSWKMAIYLRRLVYKTKM